MSENTKVEQNNVDTGEVKKVDEPKTYTQEEVDNIVKGRLARQNEKLKDLKSKNAKLEADAKSYNAMSKLLSEKGGFKGNAAEQFKQAADYYEVDENDRQKYLDGSSDDSEDVMAYFKAKKFVDESDDDEKLEEYSRIYSIPEDKRSKADAEKLKLLGKSIGDIINPEIEADRKWLKENAEGASLDKLLKSEEFAEFVEGTNMKPSTAMRKFVKTKGIEYVQQNFAEDEGKEIPASTGSAKNSGASKLKEYYSPEDVDALTDKDLDDPEIMKRVRESMTQWR